MEHVKGIEHKLTYEETDALDKLLRIVNVLGVTKNFTVDRADPTAASTSELTLISPEDGLEYDVVVTDCWGTELVVFKQIPDSFRRERIEVGYFEKEHGGNVYYERNLPVAEVMPFINKLNSFYDAAVDSVIQ